MYRGWCKLWRKSFDNPLLRDSKRLSVWVWLLSHAAHSEDHPDVYFQGKRRKLHPGQLTAGTRQIGSDLNLDKSTVHRILQFFEREAMIETEPSSSFTLISVINWGRYQNNETQNESRLRHSKDTSENLYKNDENKKNENNADVNVSLREPTPSQYAQKFFEKDAETIKSEANYWIEKGIPVEILQQEFQKFVGYWCEKNKSGTKERWQLQKTFEVRLRLNTWFSRVASDFQKKGGSMKMPDFRSQKTP